MMVIWVWSPTQFIINLKLIFINPVCCDMEQVNNLNNFSTNLVIACHLTKYMTSCMSTKGVKCGYNESTVANDQCISELFHNYAT